jgi:hypothetical protein
MYVPMYICKCNFLRSLNEDIFRIYKYTFHLHLSICSFLKIKIKTSQQNAFKLTVCSLSMVKNTHVHISTELSNPSNTYSGSIQLF